MQAILENELFLTVFFLLIPLIAATAVKHIYTMRAKADIRRLARDMGGTLPEKVVDDLTRS